MKIDIPYYIKQVLREQRKVYLPEIGTFILKQSPAHISDDKSRIYPPILDIEFVDGGSDDQSLKRYLEDTHQFSDKKIDSSISKYTQYTFDNLINHNVNMIEGLGALKRNGELDKVTFEPTLDLFTREYKNLPNLPIHPIDRIKESSVVNHAVDMDDQVVRSESKYRWLQTILAGIMIAALFIIFKKCSETDSMLYNNPDEVIESIDESSTKEVTDTFFDEASSKKVGEIDSKYKEVDEMLEVKSTPEESNTKIKEELKQLVEDSNSDKVETKTPVAASKDGVKVDNETKIETPAKSIAVEKVVEEKVISKSKNKYESIIPKSGKCIIILGSFKKASNITKMISQIERNGKKAYTSQYKGKTRVGFKFDCTNVDLDVYLNDIRKRFAVKAWYLDPTVEIPYR